ncbi:MAG: flagellar biosynthesis protein FlhB [Thermoanaerobacteraceae bacterium]|nr:flagellar biosynthesis protein FlhB [Thermoanaerobacteraceae bacterium]
MLDLSLKPSRQIHLQLFSEEKTEKPTPKRKREAREKGQVAKSTDVNAAFVLLVVLLVLYLMRQHYLWEFNRMVSFFLSSRLAWELSQANLMVLVQEIMYSFVKLMAPILAAATAAALISNFAQVGFLVAPEAIKPKLENINPVQGFKRIVSKKALVELVKALVKIIVVGVVTYYLVLGRVTDLLLVMQAGALETYSVVSSVVFRVAGGAVGIFAGIAILDYIFQRYEHEQRLKMSRQEVKEEYKQTEGDPQVKSRLKERQRELATSRMMQAVPESTVVITNPTHLAVALKYDPNEQNAPVVVAKGADYIAQKIVEVAREHEIPVVENREVAWFLHDNVEIGEEIPEELYQAVAEILVMLYRLGKKH